MPSEQAGGTQTATISTEHTLATVSTAGVYQLGVDLANLAAGDTVELRVKLKLRSGSTSRVAWFAQYTHGPGIVPIVLSPPQATVVELVATLKQTTGTGRNFEWTIIKV